MLPPAPRNVLKSIAEAEPWQVLHTPISSMKTFVVGDSCLIVLMSCAAGSTSSRACRTRSAAHSSHGRMGCVGVAFATPR